MGSKKFGGIDIAELDRAAALDSKPAEPKKGSSQFGGLNYEELDRAAALDSKTAEPEPMEPVPYSQPMSDPISNSQPMSEPVSNSQPISEPVSNFQPMSEPISKSKPLSKTVSSARSGPGFLDSVPVMGNLIRAVQKRRFGFLIWVLLNLVILGGIFDLILEKNGFLIGALAYLGGLFIVTTPIGEWIVIMRSGLKPLKPEQQLARVERILARVYAQSREESYWLKKKPRLYYDDEKYPNACAIGRGSVCVTQGLLDCCTDDEIHGILAHEMGHLAYRHPDEVLIVHVGNLFISFFLSIIGIISNAMMALVSGLLDNSRFFALIGLGLHHFFSSTLVRGWYNLGNLFTHSSSINEEYDADAYAGELGYSRQLCDALATIENGSESESDLWSAFLGDHPSVPDRIIHLQGK